MVERIQNYLSSVATEFQGVSPLPVGTARRSGLGCSVTLSPQTSVTLSNRCQSSAFTVLVGRIADPVDARISADGLVEGIYQDDLEILVGGVLSN